MLAAASWQKTKANRGPVTAGPHMSDAACGQPVGRTVVPPQRLLKARNGLGRVPDRWTDCSANVQLQSMDRRHCRGSTFSPTTAPIAFTHSQVWPQGTTTASTSTPRPSTSLSHNLVPPTTTTHASLTLPLSPGIPPNKLHPLGHHSLHNAITEQRHAHHQHTHSHEALQAVALQQGGTGDGP